MREIACGAICRVQCARGGRQCYDGEADGRAPATAFKSRHGFVDVAADFWCPPRRVTLCDKHPPPAGVCSARFRCGGVVASTCCAAGAQESVTATAPMELRLVFPCAQRPKLRLAFCLLVLIVLAVSITLAAIHIFTSTPAVAYVISTDVIGE